MVLKTKSTKFVNVFANDIRKGAEICWNNYFLKEKQNIQKFLC